LVQLPELCAEGSEAAKAGYANICEIGKERIRRAGEKILELSLESLEKEGIIEKYDRELSEADGLAKGNEFGGGGIPSLRKITKDGDLQPARPDEAGRDINSEQYSGGAGAGGEGVHPVSEDRARLKGGTGNSTVDLRTAEILDRHGYRVIDDLIGRNKQDDHDIDQETKLSKLSSKLSTDTGFRVLKLADTNMNDVYYAAGDYTQDMLLLMQDNIKPDRTDMDLLFSCLLDWGLSLSMPHTHEVIDACLPDRQGATVHTYNGGDLIACFAAAVSETVVRKIVKRQPLRAVFRDSSFTSSPEKINVTEIFKLLAPHTTVRVL
jgi:hypothetical protein